MSDRVGKNRSETRRMLVAEFPQVELWAAAAVADCTRCLAPAGKPCFGRPLSAPHATRMRAGLRLLRAERDSNPAVHTTEENR